MWYNIDMGIGQTIKILRQQQRLTQGQLEIKSGVKRSTIAMIEQEKRENPTVDTLVKLAIALGVTPDDIIHRAGILPPLPPSVADEGELLRLYRHLATDQRHTVLELVRVLSGQPQLPVYTPADWEDDHLPDELPEEEKESALTERELFAQGNPIPMTDEQLRFIMDRFRSIWPTIPDALKADAVNRAREFLQEFEEQRRKCQECLSGEGRDNLINYGGKLTHPGI